MYIEMAKNWIMEESITAQSYLWPRKLYAELFKFLANADGEQRTAVMVRGISCNLQKLLWRLRLKPWGE